jgi:hypothetical protein
MLGVLAASRGLVMRAKAVFIVAGFAILLGSSFCYADSYTDLSTDVRFTASVTATMVTLDVQCLNTSICGSLYLGDVALKGFTFSTISGPGSGPAGYMLQNGGANDSGNGGCDGKDTGKALCWAAPSPLTTQLGSTLLVFTATITDGALSSDPLHVQATGYTNSAGDQTHGGKPLAVSNDLTSGAPRVPEPGTWALLLAELAAFAVVGRWVRPYCRV